MTQVQTIADRKDYIALDFAKMFCAIIVVASHIPPFTGLANILFSQVVTRITVPFFFIVSGFFMEKGLSSWRNCLDGVLRIVRMYILYALLYLPIMVTGWIAAGDDLWSNIKICLKNSIFIGTYYHLWYFPALIFCVLSIFLLKRIRMGSSGLLILSGLLYILGLLGNTYAFLVRQIPALEPHLTAYLDAFSTTRNGLFFGLLYVSIGLALRDNATKLSQHRPYFAYFALSLVAMVGEVALLHIVWGQNGQDMLVMLPLVVVFLFLWLATTPISQRHKQLGLYCRHLSVLIYGSHLFFHLLCGALINSLFITNSLTYFLLILALTLAGSLCAVALQRLRGLHFLSWLW